MKTQGFTLQDLHRFRQVQRIAYDCVEAVQAQLQIGMTEKDAARLMRDWLRNKGVTELFHDPFAWFGDRAAFKGFWADHKFLPSSRQLEAGMAVILDIAPMVDGYSADIGYCYVQGDDSAMDGMNRLLMHCREQILADVRARKSFKQAYQNVDRLIAEAGFVNQHRRYPHRVIGHRIARFGRNPLNKIRWLGFGLPQYMALMLRSWASKLLPAQVHSPLWNDGRESDHPPFPGLWAVEPHVSLPDQSLGTKWEEILVITETDAYWLDNEVPHCRLALRKGWCAQFEPPATQVFAQSPPDALIC